MNRNAIFAAALVAAGTMGPLPAFADSENGADDQAEIQAAISAKVTMTDAIQAAEQASGGRAVEAVLSSENGKTGYEVTTFTKDGKEQNLFVDASSGKAAKATPQAENEHDGNNALDDSEEGE